MKLNKKITSLATTSVAFFSSVVSAFAATEGTGITNPVIGNLGNDAQAAASGTLATGYFVTIWNTVITIGGLVVIIMFLWGALEWITAGGDSGKIANARNRIMQSVIGLIILVSSFVILGFISELFFGGEFNLLNLSFNKAAEAPAPSSPVGPIGGGDIAD